MKENGLKDLSLSNNINYSHHFQVWEMDQGQRLLSESRKSVSYTTIGTQSEYTRNNTTHINKISIGNFQKIRKF